MPRPKIRHFKVDFCIDVLEFLDRGGSENDACMGYHISKPELKSIICWRKRRSEVTGRKMTHIYANELRSRLLDRAVESIEDSLDPIDRVVKKNEILADDLEYLPTVVNHLKNRGQNAIKVLEGLGDFRRAGDDLPVGDGQRRPLFTLPPGARVAVTLEMTGGTDAANRTIEAQRLPETQNSEGVEIEVQTGESSG